MNTVFHCIIFNLQEIVYNLTKTLWWMEWLKNWKRSVNCYLLPKWMMKWILGWSEQLSLQISCTRRMSKSWIYWRRKWSCSGTCVTYPTRPASTTECSSGPRPMTSPKGNQSWTRLWRKVRQLVQLYNAYYISRKKHCGRLTNIMTASKMWIHGGMCFYEYCNLRGLKCRT